MCKAPLTVIILTYNEEIHIERAIENVIEWADEVVVLDSNSTDRTCELARNLGAKIYFRDFDNYASQRNHAINQLEIQHEWILFLDADEYLTEELKSEISEVLPSTELDGFLIKRRMVFMNKWIRYGGYYPTWLLRLFKKSKCTYEREINEHANVKGKVGQLKSDFVDHNLKGLADWSKKHVGYAVREAQDSLKKEQVVLGSFWSDQASKKMWIRYKVWNKLPLFVRPLLFFLYRYIFRFGFLDGRSGLVFHYLQAFWLMFLIDSLIYYNSKK